MLKSILKPHHFSGRSIDNGRPLSLTYICILNVQLSHAKPTRHALTSIIMLEYLISCNTVRYQ